MQMSKLTTLYEAQHFSSHFTIDTPTAVEPCVVYSTQRCKRYYSKGAIALGVLWFHMTFDQAKLAMIHQLFFTKTGYDGSLQPDV